VHYLLAYHLKIPCRQQCWYWGGKTDFISVFKRFIYFRKISSPKAVTGKKETVRMKETETSMGEALGDTLLCSQVRTFSHCFTLRYVNLYRRRSLFKRQLFV